MREYCQDKTIHFCHLAPASPCTDQRPFIDSSMRHSQGKVQIPLEEALILSPRKLQVEPDSSKPPQGPVLQVLAPQLVL